MITAKNFWFWFGGIWSGVGVLFLVIGITVGIERAVIDEQLAARGRETDGIVLTKEISGSSNSDSRTYRVTFRFSDGQDEALRGMAELDADAWDALSERGPIRVTYLPGAPQTYRVQDQRDPSGVLSWVLTLVGGALAAVGGFVVVSALRKSRRELRLARHGVIAAATVLDIAPGNVRINGVLQWKLRYRFRDSNGREHEGSCALSAQEARNWQAGRTGSVRYDAQNPRSHFWIGA